MPRKENYVSIHVLSDNDNVSDLVFNQTNASSNLRK